MAKNRINDLIDELGKKSGISELIINKNDNVYVEKDGEMIRIDANFSDDEINDFCAELATYNRKDFDSYTPILDGNLPDGSRALHDVRRVEKLDLLGELGEPVLELLVLADAREDLVALERLGELLKHADHLRLRLFPHLLLLVHQCRVDLTKLVLKLGRVHQHEQQHLGLATLLREEGGRRGEHWHARRGPY